MTSQALSEEAQFVENLRESAMKVKTEYFLLPRHEDESTWRERVYCYELYHQLRLSVKNTNYILNGEVDKSGQFFFENSELKNAKPDFIYHRPGTQDNLVVVEVKTILASYKALTDDIDKLKIFLSSFGYKLAVMLVFGQASSRQNKRMEKLVTYSADERIIILHHGEVGEKPSEL